MNFDISLNTISIIFTVALVIVAGVVIWSRRRKTQDDQGSDKS